MEECVARRTETLKDIGIHLARRKTDGLPFGLHLQHFVGCILPIGSRFQALGADSLHLFTKRRLLYQVFLLLCLEFLEMCLMTLVDYG